MERAIEKFKDSRLAVLAIGSLGLIVLYFALLIIYRLYFHPLAKYPGRLLWKISPVPSIIALLRGRIAFEYKEMHDKYGPIVRVMPNELSFNSADAWEDIYGHRVGRPNMQKDAIHVGAVDPIPGATTLTMADDENHARIRRAVSHAFSHKALIEQENILLEYVAKFIHHMYGMAGEKKSFNLVNWYNYATFDIIGELSFGESFGCLDQEDFDNGHPWIHLIYESIKSGALEQATRRFADVGTFTQKFLMWCLPSVIRERRRKHLQLSKEKTKRRFEKRSDHRDFLWYIWKQQELKAEVTNDEITINAALFIVGGSETTATVLSGLTGYLLRDKRVYDLLTAEIRGSIKDTSDLNVEHLNSLPYFTAVLNEGLRIFPPVPVGLLRTVPEGGDIIDGHWIPAGTSVAVGAWSAAHNPANFVEPDSFIPERWFSEEYDPDKKKAARPFSLGPRGCIGKNLAWVELRLILGSFLWHFDVELVDDAPMWNPAGNFKHLRAYNTWEKPPLMARAKPVVR